MNLLKAFQTGDGTHRGLSDWYTEKEEALRDALLAHAPFDTGHYSSKHAIAGARIWSVDGLGIRVEAVCWDDLDTSGYGYTATTQWTLDAVTACVDAAWDRAEKDMLEAQPYAGFSVHDANGGWVDTYLLSTGEFDTPPGDNYAWWGWQFAENEDDINDVGVPHPDIPPETAKAFEAWAHKRTYGEETANEFRIGDWTIRSWRVEPESDKPEQWVLITYEEHEPCKVFGVFDSEYAARNYAEQADALTYEVKMIINKQQGE
jgi:hypothetical protein